MVVLSVVGILGLLPVSVVVLAAFGVAVSFGTGGVLATVPLLFPDRPGTASGFIGGISTTGGIVYPIVFGAVPNIHAGYAVVAAVFFVPFLGFFARAMGRDSGLGAHGIGSRERWLGDDEKALATLDGDPLVGHVADALAPAVDELVVNCRGDQRARLADALDGHDPRFVLDPVPDEGPVAGLRTGLRVATGRYAAVAGCDQPFLSPDVLEGLFARVETTADAGAVPLAAGRPQPLGGVYGVSAARDPRERTLAAGSGRLADVLARVSPATEAVPPGVTRDVDTRDALERARSRVGARTEDAARRRSRSRCEAE